MNKILLSPQDCSVLMRHSHQRNIDLLKVRMMLDDLEQGKWDPEQHHDNPIEVRDGVLLNGHHRCLAVMFWGQPLDIYVDEKPKRRRNFELG